MKLSENYTAELANKSSPAFLNLAKDVKLGLLPALISENPSINDVDITGFEKGNTEWLLIASWLQRKQYIY